MSSKPFSPVSVRPPAVSLPPFRPDDPRIGHLLGRNLRVDVSPRVVLVGFPVDEGVRRNGGRLGSSRAPDEVRRYLYRLTPDPAAWDPFVELLGATLDLGNLELSDLFEGDEGRAAEEAEEGSQRRSEDLLHQAQERLATLLAPYLAEGTFVVVLGGGHETAYGHFLGYVRAELPVGILNWDAHADVRPLVDGRGHSGSPFRQALEHESGLCQHYRVAGLLPQSVARDHIEFLRRHHASFLWRQELVPGAMDVLHERLGSRALVTFDLDAVDGAFAPGVSAPATGGMGSDLWLAAAYAAGKHPSVRSCDLVELNPRFDLDGRTARLAALTVWNVWRGLLERRASG